MKREGTPDPGEASPYAFRELTDTARVQRACERWPLIDAVRRAARAQRGTHAPQLPPRLANAGTAWWEA